MKKALECILAVFAIFPAVIILILQRLGKRKRKK
jgi:hypothetical protein